MFFAGWARVFLGGNWSSNVTLKEDHTLVRSGPYRIVRHPIYTGLLVALLGTAIALGELRCFLGVILAAIAWKINRLPKRIYGAAVRRPVHPLSDAGKSSGSLYLVVSSGPYCTQPSKSSQE